MEIYMKKYFDNFWKYHYLLYELVKKGIKLKYRRSYLGIIWSLLEPILTTIVLTVVFGTLFQNKEKTFPLYILTGRLLYSFFSSSTKTALKSIRQHSGMIKKVYVPKYLYPLSSILYNFVIFVLSLIVFVMLGFYCHVFPTLRWFEIFLPLFILLLLSFGVGMILATIGVFFRDMEYLWDVLLMLIMYSCAIFYKPERLLKSGYSWILTVNPLYAVIENTRNIVFGTPVNWSSMLYAAGFAAVSILIGLGVFHRFQDKFILYI
jgi:ABC-2 type transport system permease protein